MADEADDADDSPSATVTRSDSDANWRTKRRKVVAKRMDSR